MNTINTALSVRKKLPGRILRCFCFAAAALIAGDCEALDISLLPDKPRPGEAVLLRMVNIGGRDIRISFKGKEYTPYVFEGAAEIILPAGIDTTGIKKIDIKEYSRGVPESESIIALDFAGRQYPSVKLTESGEKMRDAQPGVETQQESVLGAINTRSPEKLWKEAFGMPSDNKVITPFAQKRKGKAYNYTHKGIDIRMKPGEPVKASNRGRVVLAAENYNVYGNTVIIDHGQGVVSCYFHLQKLLKEKGDTAEKGDIVGLAGSTGWSSGPHLHYAVYAHGEAIDPLWWSAFSGKTVVTGGRR